MFILGIIKTNKMKIEDQPRYKAAGPFLLLHLYFEMNFL